MTWRKEDTPGNESAKIRWEIVKYTRGRGLDIGCGSWKQFPHFIGVDNKVDNQLFGQNINPDVTVDTAEKLDVFASQSMDFVFSSHLLEHIKPESVGWTLKEWCRVIKPKGFLVLYLPDKSLYPNIGKPGANPDHKWDPTYGQVVEYMEDVPRGWDLIDYQLRDQDREYSGFYVFEILA